MTEEGKQEITEERKQEIFDNLMEIYNSFEPDEEEWIFDVHMFWMMTIYNREYDNRERIDGNWVMENCPEPLRSVKLP